MIDVAKELKKRGAKQIFMMSAYSLFTKGIEVFEEAYKEGLFTRLYTTNLSYVPKEALEKDDIDDIKSKTEALNETAMALATKVYEEASKKQAEENKEEEKEDKNDKKDDVVDADYEEK